MGSSTPELAAGAVESDPWTGAYGRALLCVAAIGVVLRLLYVLVVAPELSGGGDWRFFHATAGALADGHGYRIARPLLDRDGSRSDALYPTALHPPAYSFALALWSRWTGDDERSQRLFGIACGLATIVAVAAVGRRVAGATTGLVAAALAATSPLAIGADGALLSETLFTAEVALALLAAHALRERAVAGRAALLGLLVGIAALTRSEGLLLAPLLLVPACLAQRSPALRLLAVGLAACAATILPWTLRNWATFARPVLISTNACGVIGGANCPPTYGGDRLGAWDLACLAPPSGDEAVDAATWCAAGIAYARAHPERWPAVVAARLLRTWNLWPGTFSNVGEGRLRRADRVAKAWLLAAVLAAAGGALRLRARGEPLWPLAAPIAMTSLAGVLGWGLPRLQSGAVPSIVVLAAVAVAPLLRYRRLARAA